MHKYNVINLYLDMFISFLPVIKPLLHVILFSITFVYKILKIVVINVLLIQEKRMMVLDVKLVGFLIMNN